MGLDEEECWLCHEPRVKTIIKDDIKDKPDRNVKYLKTFKKEY